MTQQNPDPFQPGPAAPYQPSGAPHPYGAPAGGSHALAPGASGAPGAQLPMSARAGGDRLQAALEAVKHPARNPIPVLAVATGVGVALLAVGIWSQTLPVEPSCGGDLMSHRDVCEVSSSRGGNHIESYDYDEAVRREKIQRIGSMAGPVGFILASIAVIVMVLLARRSTPAPQSAWTGPGTSWHGAGAWNVNPFGLVVGPLFVGLACVCAFFLVGGPGVTNWLAFGVFLAVGIAQIWKGRPRPAELLRLDDDGLQLTRGDQTKTVRWGEIENAEVAGKGAYAHWRLTTRTSGKIDLSSAIHTDRETLDSRLAQWTAAS